MSLPAVWESSTLGEEPSVPPTAEKPEGLPGSHFNDRDHASLFLFLSFSFFFPPLIGMWGTRVVQRAAALPEDPSLVSRTHLVAHSSYSSCRGYNALLWPPWTLHACCTHTYMHPTHLERKMCVTRTSHHSPCVNLPPNCPPCLRQVSW